MVFYANERQVEGGNSPEVDTVEARFRSSKGYRGQKGERAGKDEASRGHEGGGRNGGAE